MKDLSRRNFLKLGGQGLLATAFIPSFLYADTNENMKEKIFMERNTANSLQDYFNRFTINEKIIREIMTEALSKGGDYCDLYFQHRITNYILLEDNAVNRAYSTIDFGVGIRVLCGEQTGFSFTEDLSVKAMKQAAHTAANIANSLPKIAISKINDVKRPEYYQIETPWEKLGIEDKIPYLQKLNEKIVAQDKMVVKANITFSNQTCWILFVNSEGRMVTDYQPMAMLASSCTVEKNGKREQNGVSKAGRYGIEFFTEKALNDMAVETVQKAINLFDAVKPQAGEMEVVLAAGESGILLHEAMGHGFEADFNRIKTSIFSDKLNKKIAENFVTIVDSGTNLNMRGSINIDDEGNESQETILVENGILQSYMHDRISAKFYGVKPTGNGRRESFRNMPIPRMRNTYMKNGPHTKEEIISSVKNGIYAETYTNGQVNIGAGDFSFYVKCGNIIENGRLGAPIKDVNIIGNGPKVLERIVMVANDMKLSESAYTCGKDGQGVPVSVGMPTVKVSSLTVGGVNS